MQSANGFLNPFTFNVELIPINIPNITLQYPNIWKNIISIQYCSCECPKATNLYINLISFNFKLNVFS